MWPNPQETAELGHIYWRNPWWKTSFSVQCCLLVSLKKPKNILVFIQAYWGGTWATILFYCVKVFVVISICQCYIFLFLVCYYLIKVTFIVAVGINQTYIKQKNWQIHSFIQSFLLFRGWAACSKSI